MKVILDMPQQDMGQGLAAVFEVQSQNPDQEVGKEFGITTVINGTEYLVIRNLNSYTIRSKENDDTGIPQ